MNGIMNNNNNINYNMNGNINNNNNYYNNNMNNMNFNFNNNMNMSNNNINNNMNNNFNNNINNNNMNNNNVINNNNINMENNDGKIKLIFKETKGCNQYEIYVSPDEVFGKAVRDLLNKYKTINNEKIKSFLYDGKRISLEKNVKNNDLGDGSKIVIIMD